MCQLLEMVGSGKTSAVHNAYPKDPIIQEGFNKGLITKIATLSENCKADGTARKNESGC